jgi:germination protein M
MRKRVCAFLAAVFLGLSFGSFEMRTASAAEKPSAANPYYYYEINSSETDLVQKKYTPKEENADFMIKDLMGRLNETESSDTAIKLLPSEVQMTSYEILDNVLQISFNTRYSKMSRAREILVRSGVVRTFLGVPGIDSVKFLVGGEELKDSKGQPVGEMKEGTFVSLSGTEEDAYRYDTFTLYFADSTGTRLVEEKRSVYYKRTLPKERVVLEQLAKGPMDKGHYPTIPEEVGVLSVATSDRICYVNFSETFLHAALSVEQNIPVYSVVNSLLALGNADKVQILIDGEEDEIFGADLSLYSFFEKNEELIAAE